jgi:hypothetical protein
MPNVDRAITQLRQLPRQPVPVDSEPSTRRQRAPPSSWRCQSMLANPPGRPLRPQPRPQSRRTLLGVSLHPNHRCLQSLHTLPSRRRSCVAVISPPPALTVSRLPGWPQSSRSRLHRVER